MLDLRLNMFRAKLVLISIFRVLALKQTGTCMRFLNTLEACLGLDQGRKVLEF